MNEELDQKEQLEQPEQPKVVQPESLPEEQEQAKEVEDLTEESKELSSDERNDLVTHIIDEINSGRIDLDLIGDALNKMKSKVFAYAIGLHAEDKVPAEMILPHMVGMSLESFWEYAQKSGADINLVLRYFAKGFSDIESSLLKSSFFLFSDQIMFRASIDPDLATALVIEFAKTERSTGISYIISFVSRHYNKLTDANEQQIKDYVLDCFRSNPDLIRGTALEYFLYTMDMFTDQEISDLIQYASVIDGKLKYVVLKNGFNKGYYQSIEMLIDRFNRERKPFLEDLDMLNTLLSEPAINHIPHFKLAKMVLLSAPGLYGEAPIEFLEESLEVFQLPPKMYNKLVGEFLAQCLAQKKYNNLLEFIENNPDQAKTINHRLQLLWKKSPPKEWDSTFKKRSIRGIQDTFLTPDQQKEHSPEEFYEFLEQKDLVTLIAMRRMFTEYHPDIDGNAPPVFADILDPFYQRHPGKYTGPKAFNNIYHEYLKNNSHKLMGIVRKLESFEEEMADLNTYQNFSEGGVNQKRIYEIMAQKSSSIEEYMSYIERYINGAELIHNLGIKPGQVVPIIINKSIGLDLDITENYLVVASFLRYPNIDELVNKMDPNFLDKNKFYQDLELFKEQVIPMFTGEVKFNSSPDMIRFVKGLAADVSKIEMHDQYAEYIDEAKPKNPKLFSLEASFEDYKFTVLDVDPYAFQVGIDTDCCQRLGGVGEAAAVDSFINPQASVLLLHNKDGILLAQSYFHYVPEDNGFILDNIEANEDGLKQAGLDIKANDTSSKLTDIYKKYGEIIKLKNPDINYLKVGLSFTWISSNDFVSLEGEEDPRYFAVEDPYSDYNEYNHIDLFQRKVQASVNRGLYHFLRFALAS